jgi:nickel transport protein
VQSQTMPERLLSSVKKTILLILIVSLIVFSAFPAFSHRVNIFAYVEGETIYTESYFYDGRPVKEGKIEVFDSSEKSLFAGVTDSDGLFSFKVPKIDDLTIELDATMGHRATFQITADELKQQLPNGLPEAAYKKSTNKETVKSRDGARSGTHSGTELESGSQVFRSGGVSVQNSPEQSLQSEQSTEEEMGSYQSMSIEDIRQVVREEISREIDSIQRSIARLEKQKEGPSVTEIIGGIGYIVGLAGLAMFFKSRVKK